MAVRENTLLQVLSGLARTRERRAVAFPVHGDKEHRHHVHGPSGGTVLARDRLDRRRQRRSILRAIRLRDVQSAALRSKWLN